MCVGVSVSDVGVSASEDAIPRRQHVTISTIQETLSFTLNPNLSR